MYGLWILLLLFFIAGLPVFLVYRWFKISQFPMSPAWFFLSLLAGAFSLGIAYLIPLPGDWGGFREGDSFVSFIIKFFIRTALTEEAGRFFALGLLFRLGGRAEKRTAPYPPAFGAAVGLLAGLGFAVIESASYGAADIGVALLRAFTAAPLHGACGVRVGLAALVFKRQRGQALFRFLSAAAIHGMYNFMLLSSGIMPFFSILIALAALISSIQLICRYRKTDFLSFRT
jgi:RsiW-degrading membrane proteinase PrsW (M82 family)